MPGSNRKYRNLEHKISANRVRTGVGTPSDREGRDGDMTIRTTNKGEVLYVKYKGRWSHLGQLSRVGKQGAARSPSQHVTKTDNIEASKINLDLAPRHLELTPSQLKLTGRSQGDFKINVDGGQLWIYDDTAKHFLFDCDNTALAIYDDVDSQDFLRFSTDANGVSTISTNDQDGDVGHLTLDADGDVYLDAVLANSGDKIGLKNAGTLFGDFQIHHAASWFYLYENGGASTDDYLSIKTEAHGASTIATNDSAAHAADLTLDVDGTINIDSEDGITAFKDSGTVYANLNTDRFRMFHSTDQADFFNIEIGASGATTLATVDDGATVGHLILDPDGELQITPDGDMTLVAPVGSAFKSDNSILLKELPGAVTDVSSYGQIWVKAGSPNELYFTNEDGDDIQITDGNSMAGGGGGTDTWSKTIGGYKLNNNSSSFYYTQGYPNYHLWTLLDSSPTSVTPLTTLRAGAFTADKAGSITNIRINFYALDTGLTDPLKFYVYKYTPSNGDTSVSGTLIATSDTITPVSTQLMVQSKDFSSSNTFSEGDVLIVWVKKDSTSGNQDQYMNVTISGEYS